MKIISEKQSKTQPPELNKISIITERPISREQVSRCPLSRKQAIFGRNCCHKKILSI